MAVPTRRRASGPLQALSLLTVLLLGIGCSKQAEGERCDQNNGALDCEVGLACLGEDQLSITGTGVALCCPLPPIAPTVDACRANSGIPDEPETPVVDAGGQSTSGQSTSGQSTSGQSPALDAGNSSVAPDSGQGNVSLVDSGT